MGLIPLRIIEIFMIIYIYRIDIFIPLPPHYQVCLPKWLHIYSNGQEVSRIAIIHPCSSNMKVIMIGQVSDVTIIAYLPGNFRFLRRLVHKIMHCLHYWELTRSVKCSPIRRKTGHVCVNNSLGLGGGYWRYVCPSIICGWRYTRLHGYADHINKEWESGQ